MAVAMAKTRRNSNASLNMEIPPSLKVRFTVNIST